MIRQRRIRVARHPRQRDHSWPCRPVSPRPRNSWAGKAATCDMLGALVMPLFLSVFTISRRLSTRKPLTTCRPVPSICLDLEVSMRPRKGNNNRSLSLLSLTDLHHLRRSRSWIACPQEQSAIKSSHSTSNRSVCTTSLFCCAQGLYPESHVELSALGFVTAC